MNDNRRNTYNGSYGNSGYKGNSSEYSSTLPDGYLGNGYYSDPEKKQLKKEYIIDYPKKLAVQFEKEGRGNANKRSQIRKFYEYLLRVEKKKTLLGDDFPLIEADIAGLVPYVTYAEQRRVVSRLFRQFIEKNVQAVRDGNDLKAFVKHFEAIIAFTKKE